MSETRPLKPPLVLALFGTVVLGALGLSDRAVRAHVFGTIEVTPEDDWCDVVQYAAANGDLVRLAAGDYPGDCFILKSGLPEEGEPLAIVAAGDGPVRMLGVPGRPVVTVFGNYLRLGGIHFVPAPDQPAVVGRGRSLLVDGCTFEGGAVGLDMTETTGGISLIDNLFEDVAAPIRSLCPEDDLACDKTRAVLRDNVFRSRARQPGCAVSVLARADLLAEGNVVEGRWECGLDLRAPAGPIEARHNALLGGGVGLALTAELGARVINNIVVGTTSSAIAIAPSRDGAAEVVDIAGNTLVPAAGTFVDDPEGRARRAGNALGAGALIGAEAEGDDVACAAPERCWVDAARGDYRPREDSALLGRGPSPALTSVDFCGGPRRPTNAAGAVASPEHEAIRLQPVSRIESDCLAAAYVDPRLVARTAMPLPGTAFAAMRESSGPGCTARSNRGDSAAPHFVVALWALSSRIRKRAQARSAAGGRRGSRVSET